MRILELGIAYMMLRLQRAPHSNADRGGKAGAAHHGLRVLCAGDGAGGGAGGVGGGERMGGAPARDNRVGRGDFAGVGSRGGGPGGGQGAGGSAAELGGYPGGCELHARVHLHVGTAAGG